MEDCESLEIGGRRLNNRKVVAIDVKKESVVGEWDLVG